jgi:chromosome partitioning protein
MSKEFLDLLSGMVERITDVQRQLLSLATAPHQQKSLAPIGIEKVAKMVGKATNTIRNLEAKRVIDPPRAENEGPVRRRLYDLELINKVRDALKISRGRPPGVEPVIAVFSNLKGGVGKTTTAIHYAQYACREGNRILLIDLDPQASATTIFGYIPDLDIPDDGTMLEALEGDAETIRKVIRKTYWHGLDLIPANLELQNAEYLLPRKEQFQYRLRQALDLVKDDYDIVVVDVPPALGALSINAILAADLLICPITPYMLDVASSVHYLTILKWLVEKNTTPIRLFRLLITKHDGTEESNNIVGVLRQVYGQVVMNAHMITTKEIQKATTDMLTVYEQSRPRGSAETYARAIMHFDDVNREIMQGVESIWNADLEQS